MRFTSFEAAPLMLLCHTDTNNAYICNMQRMQFLIGLMQKLRANVHSQGIGKETKALICPHKKTLVLHEHVNHPRSLHSFTIKAF